MGFSGYSKYLGDIKSIKIEIGTQSVEVIRYA